MVIYLSELKYEYDYRPRFDSHASDYATRADLRELLERINGFAPLIRLISLFLITYLHAPAFHEYVWALI